jgi:pimeloyl-ACP methyl ester carboxylesterase
MPSISYMPASGNPTGTVLLMPGRYSRASDFERNDFVSAVRERGLDVELVAVDAHLGYYQDERYHALPEVVHDDVVKPRLARGRVWFVGTSLGALGSIAYAKAYPHEVNGLVLLGAYLGEAAIVTDVERAGGLTRWRPTPSTGYDYEIRTWSWLKGYTAGAERPELFLGYGTDDRFALANTLLARVLPPTHVVVDTGGEHDFSTWSKLWRMLLDSSFGAELRGKQEHGT